MTKCYIHIFLSSLFFFAVTESLNAQLGDVEIERISDKHGLPHGRIYDIIEDHNGFIWFATQEGVFQYDGYEFKPYRHDVLDSTTLSHPYARCVYEDLEENIWIGTTYGLNLLDPVTGKFSRFLPAPESGTKSKINNIVHSIIEDKKGNLWVGCNKGLLLFDRKSKSFLVPENQIGGPNYTVWCLFESAKGTIWGGTSNGLVEVIANKSKVIKELKKHSLVNNPVYDLGEDEQGNLLLCTREGLLSWDPQASKEIRIPHLEKYDLNRFSSLIKDDNGNYWAGMLGEGLVEFSFNTTDTRYFEYEQNHQNSLISNSINCLLQDRFQNIWVGTANGICKVRLAGSGFSLTKNNPSNDHNANKISRILKDDQNNIWTKTGDGLYIIKSGKKFGEKIELPADVQHDNTFDFIFEDSDGNIWLGVRNKGIFMCNSVDTNFFKVELGDTLNQGLAYKMEQGLDNDNYLWFGTNDGFCRLNRKSFSRKWFVPKKQIPELPNNRLSIFGQGENGKIWLYYTYYNSLGSLDKNTGKFEIYKPEGAQQRVLEGDIMDFEIGANGKVYLASLYGLSCFDTRTKEFSIYTKKDGLPENEIATVVRDKNDNLWVCGFRFASFFDLEKGKFKNYSFAKRIKSFYNKSKYVSDDGQIYLGSANGFYSFHPEQINLNLKEPDIVITGFKVWNESYALGKRFEDLNEIILSHDDNNVTFEFAALHFINPDANNYRCRLLGYDKQWQELGYDRKVTYTNLNHGEYQFLIMASNSDGLWNAEPLSVDLIITPAFWQTGWFTALLILVGLSIGYAVFRSRQHQLQLKREKEIAEKTAEYKTRFLANVSHEIRTPMNAIIGFSELVLGTELNEKQKSFVSTIQKSSSNLINIINDLLDFTKLEGGHFTFLNKPFILNEVLHEIEEILKTSAQMKGLELAVNIEKNVPTAIIGDKLRLYQILINLAGNGIKFTETGKVEILASLIDNTTENASIQFEVIDTGIGIAESNLEQIFEDFSQATDETSSKYGGTGLGLSISKQLVEKQGGKMNIESTLGKGTRIWFSLNFQKSYESESEASQDPQELIFEPMDILVVEDNEFNRILAVEFLKKNLPNSAVHTAENGREALKIIKQKKIDAILMDVKMPEMNGYDATKQIRKLKDTKQSKIPIIGLTANSTPDQIKLCKSAGMNECVTKPFNAQELLMKLHLLTQNNHHGQS